MKTTKEQVLLVHCPACENKFICTEDNCEDVLKNHLDNNVRCTEWNNLLKSMNNTCQVIQNLTQIEKTDTNELVCKSCLSNYSNIGNYNRHIKNHPECRKLNIFKEITNTNNTAQFPRIKKFDPAILEYKRLHGQSPVIAIVGKRCCGKSTLINNLVQKMTPMRTVIMSETEISSGFYSKHIPLAHIYEEYDPGKIQDIINEQTKKANEIKITYPDKKFTDFPEYSILIIMDDLVYDNKMMKDPGMKQLFFNGRHLNITLIIAFQYIIAIPPLFRTNIDFLFSGYDNEEYENKLYTIFFGFFEKFAEFRMVFKAATVNYGYLVLDKTTLNDSPTNNVFWYRAL